jgi:hypothetical protein
MILKRNDVNWIGKDFFKDVKVYCKFWKKKIIKTIYSKSRGKTRRGKWCGIFLNTGCVEAIERREKFNFSFYGSSYPFFSVLKKKIKLKNLWIPSISCSSKAGFKLFIHSWICKTLIGDEFWYKKVFVT